MLSFGSCCSGELKPLEMLQQHDGLSCRVSGWELPETRSCGTAGPSPAHAEGCVSVQTQMLPAEENL